MSGEWKGWQTWNTYLKAGIVENSVDFSEEAIIVDHAVGRTKDAIGKCWPMDAAVAYTLMKAGPDVSLTWSEMVNTYTRSASVMMTGKVGYGLVPTPNVASCGHDEVMGYNHVLGAPQVVCEVFNMSTNWGSGALDSWFEDNTDKLTELGHDVDALSQKYSVIRASKQLDLRHTHLMKDSFFDELVDAFQDFFGSVGINPDWNNSSIIKNTTRTFGECAWAQDSDKTCRHHDRPTTRIWSMMRNGDSDFVTAWRRGPCRSGDNYDQWPMSTSHMIANNVVAWDEMRRGMSQAVPEGQVISDIRDSLARMLKRNDNIVSKAGRGKNSKHKWSDWGWLAEMSAYVKNTSSKNRKEGDVENGWKYSKVRSRRSFGHEIADFVWKPVDEIKDFLVGRQEPNDWGASSIMSNLRFSTKQQCIDFMSAVAQAHIDNGGHYKKRTHQGLDKNDDGKWSIRSNTIEIVMHGRVDPEDYLSPQEVINMWRHASRTVLDEHRNNFERAPPYSVSQAPPENEASD
jgi:hypothetical protein